MNGVELDGGCMYIQLQIVLIVMKIVSERVRGVV